MSRTTISLPLDVKKRLTLYGNMSDSYADVIVMLMDKYDEFAKLEKGIIIENQENNNSKLNLNSQNIFDEKISKLNTPSINLETPNDLNEVEIENKDLSLELPNKTQDTKGKKLSSNNKKFKSTNKKTSSKNNTSKVKDKKVSSKNKDSKVKDDKTSKSKQSSFRIEESSKNQSQSKHRDLTKDNLDDEIKKLEELYHIKL